MEIEKSRVLIQFLLVFRQSGDVLFSLYACSLRGYTATATKDSQKKAKQCCLDFHADLKQEEARPHNFEIRFEQSPLLFGETK